VKPTTALVVSGGGLQGLALVKALRAVGDLRVLVADCNAEHVTGYMACASHRAPLLADAAAFDAFLLQLCQDEEVHAVFPATNFELDALVRGRAALQAAGTQVWVSAPEVLALARSKRVLYSWLQQEGLAVLPCFADALDPDASFPLIGKPDNGWGGRGLVRLLSRADALQWASGMEAAAPAQWAWQPMLRDFDEISVDFAVDEQGVASELFLRRRLVVQGGFAVLCEPESDAPSFVAARALAAATVQRLAGLGARGVLNLQVLVQGQHCWVSDFNARVGTSMPLTLAAGGNPVAFLLAPDDPGAPTGLHGDQGVTHAKASESHSRSFRVLQERVVKQPPVGAVQGLVFDLDDTLFDQKDWIVRKLQILWQQAQATLPPQDRFLATAIQILEEGERAHLLDKLCQQLDLPAQALPMLISLYRSIVPPSCHVYADVWGTLSQLRRAGYRLGLLTDNPAASQRQKLQVCGLDALFDAVVLTGDLGQPKPSRVAFDAVAQALALPPSRLVMVGDNPFRDSGGALASGWAHAFHIHRDGAFFNFQLGLCGAALPLERITVLQDLNELTWYLRGAPQP
jgi:FMN phosphatase YigB (HAD superfamily)/carbamoylphosphate synthase large subunit